MTFLTPNILGGYDWRGLERGVARLVAHAGWKEVSVIGGAGDMGGDVVGVFDGPNGESPWVFQVKALTGDRYIGPTAVDEAIHALSTYNCKVAVVVTNGTFTNTALIRQKQLIANGFDTKLWNGAFLQQLIDRLPKDHASKRGLRPYQQTIADKAIAIYNAGGKRAFYIVATGLGKTIIAASIARKLWELGNHRILVLCHTIPLAQQLEEGFWPQLSKDIPTSVFYDGLPPRTSEGISFGLYQSLYSYLPGLDEDQFDIIIVDEAHHALAQGFRTCLEKLKPKFLIGMTATPWRGDGQNLNIIFGSPIATMSLVDGMAQGYLSAVDYRIFCDNLNWDEIPKLSKKKLSIRDLNKKLFLPQRDEAVITEIQRAISEVKKPRIAIFSPSRTHGERFANMLSSCGIPCAALSCGDKIETRKRLLGFESGAYSAVTAVDVMNEGIDVPDVNILVFLRATHSRRIFVQQLGRGLRISEGKEKVIVLDFVSDVRRMAEVVEMNNEGKVKGADKEILFLKNGIVSFTNEKMGKFVNTWLEDVADLGDADESAKLTFPEEL
jgi:superfamily II DNA or RNA helicase